MTQQAQIPFSGQQECVRLVTRVPHVSRVPQIERQERDSSFGLKVTITLPIFSRTALFHLAAKSTYHSKGQEASLAAYKFYSSRFIYMASSHVPT